ncbi:MAG: hypothetical protein ABII71_04755 [Candidatus Micrarchaeota archaeon]
MVERQLKSGEVGSKKGEKQKKSNWFKRAVVTTALLVAPLITSCGAKTALDVRPNPPTDASGPDAAPDARPDSGPDSDIDNHDADAPFDAEPDSDVRRTITLTETETEEISFAMEREYRGEGCRTTELEYMGFEIEVENVEVGPDAVGLWTGNLVDVDVRGPEGFRARETLTSSLGSILSPPDSIELTGNIRVSAGYALDSEGYVPCAEIRIYDSNDFAYTKTTTLERVVYEDDPEFILYETMIGMEIEFAEGIFLVQGDELGMHDLFYRSELGVLPYIDLRPFMDDATWAVHVTSEDPEDAEIQLTRCMEGEFCGGEALHERNRVFESPTPVEMEEVFIDPDSNSIQTTVSVNGFRMEAFNNLHGFTWDEEGNEYVMYVLPMVLNELDLGVWVEQHQVLHRFRDGDIVEAEGASWDVSVGTTGREITSVGFSRR